METPASAAPPGYEIRPLRAGDEGALLVTYPAAFGRPRELAEWRWAFRANPAGTRVFVAERDGELVAQYAAWPVRTWIDGRYHTFCQVVDSMVHPEHRAGLKKPGLFVRVAEAFFAAYGGRERDVIFYGWPVRANRRIGERHLAYERVQSQLVLGRPLAGPSRAATATGAARVEPLERFGDEARWLYERCVDEWGASAVRDGPYLDWRYVDRPGACYVRLGARDRRGVLRGLAVLRVRELEGERVGLIAEWLVPPAEPDVGHALLAGCEAAARGEGAASLALFVPGWSAWFERLQAWGFRVRPTAYDLVTRSFHPRFDAAFLRDRWWYQLGDSDLV